MYIILAKSIQKIKNQTLTMLLDVLMFQNVHIHEITSKLQTHIKAL